MNVKELKALLRNLDDDTLVVLSSDAEGNQYSKLVQVDLMQYDGESVGLNELTPEAKAQGYTEEDVMENGTHAVVLYP